MGVLAVSSQEEQAVASTTLGLWRSSGTVMGVALTGLIFQNALILYLDQLVTGKQKADILYEVRRSVHAINELDPLHQKQVIDAYSHALQITFALAAAMSVIMVLIITPTKLPRLGKKS
ncbi:MAG: hypothetical protein LQ347_002934 [Umbilicaria vellea]|nr:MAG: hypothetical protein LQ347_002934 [Umbilicaria vellea]